MPTRPRTTSERSRDGRRGRRLAACSLLLLVPALGACGFDVQTDQVYEAAAGTNARIDFANSADHVDILNSIIVTKKDGQGVWAGSLVNISHKDSDKLVEVSSGTLTDGLVGIRPDSLVNFGATGELVIDDSAVKPGNYVPLTFTFSSGQTTKVLTPVVEFSPSGDYSAVPMPTPSATTQEGQEQQGQEQQGQQNAPSSPESTSSESASPGSTPSS